jgi:hypothetical protein
MGFTGGSKKARWTKHGKASNQASSSAARAQRASISIGNYTEDPCGSKSPRMKSFGSVVAEILCSEGFLVNNALNNISLMKPKSNYGATCASKNGIGLPLRTSRLVENWARYRVCEIGVQNGVFCLLMSRAPTISKTAIKYIIQDTF